MTKHILVLGSTGTTGRETVRALLARGARVRAATRDPAKHTLAGAELVAFSYDDRSTWAPAFEGIDAVYLVIPGFRPDEVQVGAALIDAAQQAGVKRLVKLSAMGVEHNPESGHRQVEQLIEGSGLQWVHLRPTFFMDNFVSFYGEGIRSEGAIALPAGAGRTGFVAASDIGDAAAEALLGGVTGEAWELTGPESLDHGQVADILTDVVGKPVQFVDIAPQAHIEGMKQWGMPELAVATMSGLYQAVRAGQTAAVTPTVGAVTGHPPVRFREWAKSHAEAWS